MKDIIIAGIQGSGKGTQAEKILEYFGDKIAYFETGNILRALQSNNNAIGNFVRGVVNSGTYVDDEFMVALFDLFLLTLKGGKICLMDGFPRQLDQMKGFLERMSQRGREFVVILLDIPAEKVIAKLESRRICKSCGTIYSLLLDPELKTCSKCEGELYQRADDADTDAIRKRIQQYNDLTQPVMDEFEKMGLVKKIDADQSIEKVFEDIQKIISE